MKSKTMAFVTLLLTTALLLMPAIAPQGAFAAATGEFTLEDLTAALAKRFQGKMQEANILAATQGFEFVKNKMKG